MRGGSAAPVRPDHPFWVDAQRRAGFKCGTNRAQERDCNEHPFPPRITSHFALFFCSCLSLWLQTDCDHMVCWLLLLEKAAWAGSREGSVGGVLRSLRVGGAKPLAARVGCQARRTRRCSVALPLPATAPSSSIAIVISLGERHSRRIAASAALAECDYCRHALRSDVAWP